MEKSKNSTTNILISRENRARLLVLEAELTAVRKEKVTANDVITYLLDFEETRKEKKDD